MKDVKRLQEIHEEMQLENYSGHVDMGHCEARDFAFWFSFFANYETNLPERYTLADFDIESVVGKMASWIKAPFSTDLHGMSKPGKGVPSEHTTN